MVFLHPPPPPIVPPAAIIKQLNNAEDNRPTVGGLQIYATFLHRDAAVLHTDLPIVHSGDAATITDK
jgi:hypothetical protein